MLTSRTMEGVMVFLLILARTTATIYMANNSLAGLQVSCSDAEKDCLRVNRILHSSSGKCYRPGKGPMECPQIALMPVLTTGERIRTRCVPLNVCPAGNQAMAADGRCVTPVELLSICNPTNWLAVSHHPYGGVECVCTGASCQIPPLVHQPDLSGRCLLPDFRVDAVEKRYVLAHGSCSLKQRLCFSKGKLSYGLRIGCYDILERGPCSTGQRLVLDAGRAAAGTIEVKCLSNPCPEGERRLGQTGPCYGEEQLKSVCNGSHVFQDVFGNVNCVGVEGTEVDSFLRLSTPSYGKCRALVHIIAAQKPGVGNRETAFVGATMNNCPRREDGSCAKMVFIGDDLPDLDL